MGTEKCIVENGMSEDHGQYYGIETEALQMALLYLSGVENFNLHEILKE